MSTNLVPTRPTPRGLLKGKNVLITAAAGTGIGYATAERMAEEGARVFISDMHERRLGEAADRLTAAHGGVRPGTLACDVTQEAQVQALVAAYPRLPDAPEAGNTYARHELDMML